MPENRNITFERLSRELGALSQVWPVATTCPVSWDPIKRVHAARRSTPTYRSVWGTAWPLRAERARRQIETPNCV